MSIERQLLDTMTDPKEEAKRIYDSFYIICQEYTEEIQCSIQAKHCALLHVDGLIKLDNHWASQLMQDPNTEGYKSDWIAVRQELEKM